MAIYLELSEDDMVNLLAELQKLARDLHKLALAKPYNKSAHERACDKYLAKSKWLAYQGDVV